MACATGNTSNSANPAASDLNTASQKSFENSANLVDVTDAPVSLSSEKVIYPPSTGNAGLARGHGSDAAAVVLVGAAVLLVAGTRMFTAPRFGLTHD